MTIKPDWLTWLHQYRRREVEAIFTKCPSRLFAQGLELGAGDGFQSALLAQYVSQLISTDLNPDRLQRVSTPSIEYRICDAEDIDRLFAKRNRCRTSYFWPRILEQNFTSSMPAPNRPRKWSKMRRRAA